jgi:hypothetical protein
MDVKKILQKIVTNTEEAGLEAAKTMVGEVDRVITGKELLSDISKKSSKEIDQMKTEDEQKKMEEMKKIRGEMGQGRNVTEEMREITRQKEEEAKKEEDFLKRIEAQREAEKKEREAMWAAEGAESSNPAKRKKQRGSALMGGKQRKNSQPDLAAMSQTSEFKGGKID